MAERTVLIAVTGGIGSGKSVVCRMLHELGYRVYDCDSRAKELMDSSDSIKKSIACSISEEVITDAGIDRSRLSEIVFNDIEKLAVLNGIVHRHVLDDICRWSYESTDKVAFIETAILYQSGLDGMVHRVWDVIAPIDLRVRRVMKRNGLDEASVLARIRSQESFVPENMHPRVDNIINDDVAPLLPRIEMLLSCI